MLIVALAPGPNSRYHGVTTGQLLMESLKLIASFSKVRVHFRNSLKRVRSPFVRALAISACKVETLEFWLLLLACVKCSSAYMWFYFLLITLRYSSGWELGRGPWVIWQLNSLYVETLLTVSSFFHLRPQPYRSFMSIGLRSTSDTGVSNRKSTLIRWPL